MKPDFPKMHIGLKVSNLESSIRFYSYMFGIAPTKVKQDYVKFMVQQPALVLSLSQSSNELTKHQAHYGVQIETHEILQNWKSNVLQRGLELHSEETGTRCCYALQDKFWLKDPDSIMWEIYYFHEDVDENDKKYQDHETVVATTASTKENVVKCCDPQGSTINS